MVVLPKHNTPVNQRKKAVPGFKPVEPPKPSLDEKSLPKEEISKSTILPKKTPPKKAEPVKSMVSKPEVVQDDFGEIIDSKETFGCCGWHSQCTEAGDCVRKNRRIHYATTCSYYKVLMKGAK